MRRSCACLLAGIVVVVGGLAQLPTRADVPGPVTDVPRRSEEFELRGAGSCAASACHNGNGPRGAKGGEYTTWVAHDRHARAFEVLYDERSLRIQRNRPDLRDEEKSHPERDPLCLKCHVGPTTAPRRDLFAFSDGVSCEACHGAAGGWLTQHYTKAWQTKTAKEKAAAGMTDTKDLTVRAGLCVECHVGKGGMDVNHDLIAAGHPRLAFEYAAFHANMPKHWDAARETKDRPDFDAQLWLIGQIVSARASLRLLHDRASDGGKPWPEFAESDCFACHHDLTDQKWRRDPDHFKKHRGVPAWGSWYFALDDVVKQHPPKAGLAYPQQGIAELRRLMAGTQDRKEVAKIAAGAADALDGWLPALAEPAFDWQTKNLDAALDQKLRKDLDVVGWDEATQLYLALMAQRPERKKADFLARYRKALDFPGGFDSRPRFDPAELRKILTEP